LREQLIEAGFPRGIGVASVTSFVLLIFITGFTAVYLATASPLSLFGAGSPTTAVPEGVLEDQQQAAVSLSQAVATSATTSAGDLRVAARSGVLDAADTDKVLTTLSQTYPSWRGSAVLDTASRKPLGTHGEPVPTEGLRGVSIDKVTVQPVVHSGGNPMVVTAVPLSGPRAGQLLVVSTALREAAADLDQNVHESVRLVATDGTVLDNHGPELAKTDTVALGLVDRAVAAAGLGRSGVSGKRLPSGTAN
jgi:hypothetical protein